MKVELGPNGTRGVEMPKAALPLMKVMSPIMHFWFRLRRGQVKMQGQPLLLLDTVGAKTGKQRHVLLTQFPDRDRADTRLIVGSAAGSIRHPAWCYNLAKNPDQATITVGDKETKVTAETLKGAEREEAWKRIVAAAPGYGKYETKTDRQMPVFRLTPSV